MQCAQSVAMELQSFFEFSLKIWILCMISYLYDPFIPNAYFLAGMQYQCWKGVLLNFTIFSSSLAICKLFFSKLVQSMKNKDT